MGCDPPHPRFAQSDILLVSRAGVWGYPSRATAEKGRELVEQTVRTQADYIMDTISRLEGMRNASSTPRQARAPES